MRDALAAAPGERQAVSGPPRADCVSYRVVQAAPRTGAGTVEGGRRLGQLSRALAMAVCRTGGEGWGKERKERVLPMGGEGEGERARFEQREERHERVLQRHSTIMMRKRVWGKREKEMGGGSP